jgi:hypothetical protein
VVVALLSHPTASPFNPQYESSVVRSRNEMTSTKNRRTLVLQD